MRSNAVVGPVLCACGWHGRLPRRSPCPACGRSIHDRVTPDRLAAMRALEVRPSAPIAPAMRIRLCEIGLIAPAGNRPAGSETRRARAPQRPHVLTPLGQRVLEVARVLDQTRHDVAVAAARHADLGDASVAREVVEQVRGCEGPPASLHGVRIR